MELHKVSWFILVRISVCSVLLRMSPETLSERSVAARSRDGAAAAADQGFYALGLLLALGWDFMNLKQKALKPQAHCKV